MSSEPGPLEPIRNEPREKECPTCHRPLTVRDTFIHEVWFLAGKRAVTEVTLRCPLHRRRVFHPPPLTPDKSPFAFDVVAEAGRLRFLEQRQLRQIAQALHERGLPLLGERTVQRLTDRFLLYHTAVHLESLPRLREALRQKGGYVLVLDATGTPGAMTLVLTDDDDSGGTGWVLLAAPITDEGPEQVRPHLDRLKGGLGPPLTGISDQSDGLRGSFREVFPGVYLLLCQFHVLRSIGERLAGKRYRRFHSEVERSGVKRALRSLRARLRRAGGKSREARRVLAWVEEILSWERAAHGRTFPFFWSALEFYSRSEKVRGELETVLHRPGRRAKGAPYLQLRKALDHLRTPGRRGERLARDFPALQGRWGWFERTRKVLGYRNGPVPLSPQGTLSEKGLERGRRRMDWFEGKIQEELRVRSRSPLTWELHRILQGVAKKLKEHREELFAPNVRVRVKGRWVVRRIHRSNGSAERKFHGLRHTCRRITGDDGREGQVQREGPGMLMVRNLEDSRYLRLLYGAFSHLGERFAQVGETALADAKLVLARKDAFTSARKALRQR